MKISLIALSACLILEGLIAGCTTPSGFAVQIAYGEEGHRADVTGNSETDS